ncbi:PilZ domain-containing protein, partial [Hydrogenivirga sp.]
MGTKGEIGLIIRRLSADNEFFVQYKPKFQEVFLKYLSEERPKLLSSQSLNTLVDKLYIMMFSFNRDPTQELSDLAYKLAGYEIDLTAVLSKALLEMLKDYIDHVINTNGTHESIKAFVSLIDHYLSAVESAYTKYIDELRTEIKKRDKVKVEGERGLIIEFFENQFSQGKRNIEIITFYKEVPVICRSRIIDIEEGTLAVSLCDLNVFNIDDEVYIKHINLPKTVAVIIRDIDKRNEVMEVEIIGFVDLPQERRGYVRVAPKEPIRAVIEKGGQKVSGSITDISVGGVGIYTKDVGTLREGDRVVVMFRLPKGEVETEATVRHIEEYEDALRVGLSYELDIRKEEVVSDYVMERQFEILRELKGS